MTLVNKVLQRLAEWQPTGGERETLVLPELPAGWSVRVVADQQNPIGCLVREIEAYRSASAVGAQALELRERSQTLTEQVRGFREALTVLEVDETRNQALLRSKEPALRDEAVSYFEALVDGKTRVRLRRYQAGTRREEIAFALTHDALADVIVGLLVD